MTLKPYPLNVAIIGAGEIAHTHARAYTAQPERCTLVAVADIAPRKAERLAADFGCQAYPDMGTMLDQVAPDAVSVCTPPAIHLQCTRAAIEHGVPVLCEKPLSHDLRTAREMVSMAARAGVALMTGFCHRFHGPMVQLKEMIEAGQLGQIVYFRNRFASHLQGVEDTWFVVPEVSGGGVLIDTQVHAIDLFRHLVGRIASVSAFTDTHLSISVEDSAVVLMQSVDGVAGVTSASWISPPGEATVEVFGTQGTAVIDYSVEDGQLRYRLSGETAWTCVPYDGPDRFANEITHFLECVAEDRAPLTDGNEGVRVMAVIEAAYRAARNGTVEET